MNKNLLKVFALSLFLSSCGNSFNAKDYDLVKKPGSEQFDFPGNYIDPELKVDGLNNEEQWKQAAETIKFGYDDKTSFTMYRGERALYMYIDVQDEDIQTIGNSNGEEVTQSDSIEVYFDFLNDGARKPQTDDIQINIAANGRTRIFAGSTSGYWGVWNGLIDFEINLRGTLNDNSDIDDGYSVELMIPYSQVGISKDDVFGMSLGSVRRGNDSTHPRLDYTWSGISFDGKFIDPQIPQTYFLSSGNKYFSKDKFPKPDIKFDGYVYDQKHNPVSNVSISLAGKEVSTNENGYYVIDALSPNETKDIVLSKDGFTSYTETLSAEYLRSAEGNILSKDFVLIDNAIKVNCKLSGVVVNPVDGIVQDALVKVNDQTTATNENGQFEINYTISNKLEIQVSKDGYKVSDLYFDTAMLAGNDTYDLGNISIYSPSSLFTFGGARETYKVDGEVFRGVDGIYFNFQSKKRFESQDTVQLFIDTLDSSSSRDETDYRFDFNGLGEINIMRFGGSNNIPVYKSGVKNNAYFDGENYHMDTYIPYEYLEIDKQAIIGFSCGSYCQKDWDGMAFIQEGFDDYVAPEVPERYVRVALDNGLYKAYSNYSTIKKIYGTIKDQNGNAISNATINKRKVEEDGTYRYYVDENRTDTILVECEGYSSYTIQLSEIDSSGKKDIVLNALIVSICGKITDQNGNQLDGIIVKVKDDETYNAISANGAYSLECPTGRNITLQFVKDNVVIFEKTISKNALSVAVSNGVAYTLNVSINI